jgi:hypothetical protein
MEQPMRARRGRPGIRSRLRSFTSLMYALMLLMLLRESETMVMANVMGSEKRARVMACNSAM